eukprot:2494365-Karenia_brevis.AAC.1
MSFIAHAGSKAQKRIQKAVRSILQEEMKFGTTPLYFEKGLFNTYLHIGKMEQQSAVDVCVRSGKPRRDKQP